MLSDALRRVRAAAAAEDGSTLVLYPFAVLVVLALGGVALDVALFFQAHRESVDVEAGLASDIAGVVDEEVFATSANGTLVIDAVRAQALVDLTNLELLDHPRALQCRAAIEPRTPTTVDVVCVGRANALLLPVAGLGGGFDLRGVATASTVIR